MNFGLASENKNKTAKVVFAQKFERLGSSVEKRVSDVFVLSLKDRSRLRTFGHCSGALFRSLCGHV